MDRKDHCSMLTGKLKLSRRSRAKGEMPDQSITTKNGFIRDTQQLETVLGQSQSDWFEKLTEQRLEWKQLSRPHPSGVFDSPSATPTISQLINVSGLRVGSSPGFSYDSPVRFSSSYRQSPIRTPDNWNDWQKPLLGLSPSPRQPPSSKPLSHPTSAAVQSLGVLNDDSALFWTNSLATPPRDISDLSADQDVLESNHKELARALFSPSDRLNTTGDSVQPLDSTYEDDQSTGQQSDLSMDDVTEPVSCRGDNLTSHGKQEEPMGRCVVQNVSGFAEISCESDDNEQDKTSDLKGGAEKQTSYLKGSAEKQTSGLKDSAEKQTSEEKHRTEQSEKPVECVMFKSALKNENTELYNEKKLGRNWQGEKNSEKEVIAAENVEKEVDISEKIEASPTFTQKCSRKCFKGKKLETAKRRAKWQEVSVDELLSDFFDSPASAARKRRQSATSKLDAVHTEASYSSPILSKTLSSDVRCSTPKERTAVLQSILSSSQKKKGSSSGKKVRFSENVKKYSISSKYPSILKKKEKTPSNLPPETKKVKFEEVILSYKETEDKKDSDVDGSSEHGGISNKREETGIDETGDSRKVHTVLSKCGISDKRETLSVSNIRHENSHESSNSISVDDEMKGVDTIGDEFSQISQTSLNEMCSVAEQSGSYISSDVERKDSRLHCDDSVNEKKVTSDSSGSVRETSGSLQEATETLPLMSNVRNRRQAPLKFMYPSTSHIAISFPKVFKYEENSQTTEQEGLVRPVLARNIVPKKDLTNNACEGTSTAIGKKEQQRDAENSKSFDRSNIKENVESRISRDTTAKTSEATEINNKKGGEIGEVGLDLTIVSSFHPSNLEGSNMLKSFSSNRDQGFQSASGKSLKLTTESLEKASRLLSEENGEINVKPRSSTDMSPKSLGESLAEIKGKHKAHSEKEMIDFSDEWTDDFDYEAQESKFNPDPPENEQIDKETVTERRHIEQFSDSFYEKEELVKGRHIEKQDVKQAMQPEAAISQKISESSVTFMEQSSFNGFKTASGKKLKCSEEALRKAETRMNEDKDGTERFITSSKNPVGDNKPNIFDQQNLLEAKRPQNSTVKELIDIDETHAENLVVQSAIGGMSTSIGFSTAAGKQLMLSDSNIKKARSMLSDFMEEKEEHVHKEIAVKFTKEQKLSVADRLKLEFQKDCFGEVSDVDSIAEELQNLKSKKSIDSQQNTANEIVSIPVVQSIKPASKPLQNSNLPQGFRPFKPPRPSGNKSPGNKSKYPESKTSEWNCTEKTEGGTKGNGNILKQKTETLIKRNSEITEKTEVSLVEENRLKENKDLSNKFNTIASADNSDVSELYQGLSQVFSEELDVSFEDTKSEKGKPISPDAHASRSIPIETKLVSQCSMGFTSASGKHFSLSKGSVLSAQKVLADTEDCLEFGHKNNGRELLSHLSENSKTACNVGQELSYQYTSKPKASDFNEIPNQSKVLPGDDHVIPPSCCKSSLNTSIASMENDSVGRHEHMDDKAENELLSSIDLSNSCKTSSHTILEEENDTGNTSKTVSNTYEDNKFGKIVEASNEGTEGTENAVHLGIYDNGDVHSTGKTETAVFVSETEQSGFQTASGKHVKLSGYAIANAQHILDIDNRSGVHEILHQLPEESTSACKDEKKESVIQEKKCLETYKSTDDGITNLSVEPGRTEAPSCVFKTATGKPVHVSEGAIQSSKQYLEQNYPITVLGADSKEIRTAISSLVPDCNDHKKIHGTVAGFQTASGKAVHISAESIENAKQALSVDMNENSRNCDNDVNEYDNSFVNDKFHADFEMATIIPVKHCDKSLNMFQTASCRPVEISDDVLSAAKRKLDIDIDSKDGIGDDIVQLNSEILGHVRHDSAKKKRISEQQVVIKVENSNEKKCEFSSHSKETDVKNLLDEMCFFQTASGKKVHVSEQPLKVAKTNLNNIDNGTGTVLYGSHASDVENCQYTKVSSAGVETYTSDTIGTLESKNLKSITSSKISTSVENRISQMEQSIECFATPLYENTVQTASGCLVSVSDKSLSIARKTFDDIKESQKPIDANPFQTASGCQVRVPEKALAFARKTLEDTIDIRKETSYPNPFQTASGGPVRVSERALAFARKALEDQDDIGIECSSANPFKTASGKHVKVSEKALAFARKTVEDHHDTKKEISCTNPFQTATGGQVMISEKSLAFARKTFEEIGDSSKECDSANSFKTASGGQVKVSDKAFAFARKTLENTNDIKKAINCPNPFQTALGGNVKVSEKALAFARRTLEDTGNIRQESRCANPFKTASGGQVKVSEKALAFARKTLEETGEDEKNFDRTSPFSARKTVDISENTAAEEGKSRDEKGTVSTGLGGSHSVQTASGGIVKVSEKALAFARKALSDTNVDLEISENISSLLSTSGSIAEGSDNIQAASRKTFEMDMQNTTNPFQTASGSKVKVSDKALAFARKTLDEADHDIKGLDPVSPFQSASGKVVKVSEKALAVARRMADKNNGDAEKTVELMETYNIKDAAPKRLLKADVINSDCGGSNGGEEVDSFCEELLKLQSEKDKVMRKRSSNNSTEMDAKLTDGNTVKSAELNDGPPVKRQRLGDGMEKAFDANVDRGSLKRKPVRTRPEGITTDRRHPGFRPFIPVCSKMLQPQATTLDSILQSSGTSRPKKDSTAVKPAFHTPYRTSGAADKSTSGTLDTVKVTTPIFRNSLIKGESTQVALNSSSGITENIHSKESVLTVFSSKVSLDKLDTANVASDAEKADAEVAEEFMETGPILVSDKTGDCKFSVDLAQDSSKVSGDTAVSSTSANGQVKFNIKDVGKEEEVDELDADMESYSQDEEDVFYCNLVEARRQQEEMMQNKGRVRPTAGRLYEMKQTKGRWRLKDLISRHRSTYARPAVCSGSAAEYRFRLDDHYTQHTAHVLVGDGAYLVPDDSGHAGRAEFYRGFLTLSGVDPKLITEVWLYNHYRWIVWKLAAYEACMPDLAGRCLTPEMVMLQLKYRYDREIDLAQRSAVRKIFERDDTASKRTVLCVAGVQHVSGGSSVDQAGSHMKNPDSKVVLELTDGWYSIRAAADVPMTDLVHRGRVGVGQKMCITGAEVVGGEDACSPLEAPESVMLKFCSNSARPCSWDTPLGYQKDPRPLCVPLCSLYGEGGAVGVVDVVVVRKYPIMYMEKLPGGGSVFRTGRCEEKVRQEFESHKEVDMQKLYRDIEALVEKENRLGKKQPGRTSKKWTRSEVEGLGTGQEIYEGLNSAQQPDTFQNYLSDRQLELLYEYQRRVHEEEQADLNSRFQAAWRDRQETAPDRNVTPVLKFRVSGCSRKDMDSGTSTILTVWRPAPEISDLQEGKRYKIYSLNTSTSRSKYTGHTVQLTATKQTKFQPMSLDENFLDSVYEPREVLWVSDVTRRKPAYGELDFVGLVVKVVPASAVDSGKPCDTVYLADCQGSILTVRLWNGFKSFGEDLFAVGIVLCCCNLMDKSSFRSQHLPTVEAASESTLFTKKPQNSGQRKALERLNSAIQDNKGFLETAQKTLEALLSGRPAFSESHKMGTPSRRLEKDTSSCSSSILTDASIPGNTDNNTPCKTPDRLPLISDDDSHQSDHTHSSNTANTSTPQSESVKAKKSIYQAKMGRLLSYNSPGVLSPMNTPVTKGVRKAFKPPTFKKN